MLDQVNPRDSREATIMARRSPVSHYGAPGQHLGSLAYNPYKKRLTMTTGNEDWGYEAVTDVSAGAFIQNTGSRAVYLREHGSHRLIIELCDNLPY